MRAEEENTRLQQQAFEINTHFKMTSACKDNVALTKKKTGAGLWDVSDAHLQQWTRVRNARRQHSETIWILLIGLSVGG